MATATPLTSRHSASATGRLSAGRSQSAQSLRNVVGHRLSRVLRLATHSLDQFGRQTKRHRLVSGNGTARSGSCASMTRQNLGAYPTADLDGFIGVVNSLFH